MRRAIFVMIVLAIFVGSWSLAQDRATGFAGRWVRDETRPRNGDHLQKETWEITIGEKTMTRRVSSEGSKNIHTSTYNLDGTDSSIEVSGCHGRSRILRLRKIQAREIEVTEILPACAGLTSDRTIITEIWKLIDDGNTLSVVRELHLTDPRVQIPNNDQKYLFQREQPSSDHETSFPLR